MDRLSMADFAPDGRIRQLLLLLLATANLGELPSGGLLTGTKQPKTLNDRTAVVRRWVEGHLHAPTGLVSTRYTELAEAFVHVVWSLSVRNTGGLNRGAILCHRYREQILESVHTLSGYDASKLFCSMSFLDCMSPEICAKLMKIIAQRIHTYDSSQLQSILNASETLDLSNDMGCASEEEWFAFNQRIQSELAGAGRPKGGV